MHPRPTSVWCISNTEFVLEHIGDPNPRFTNDTVQPNVFFRQEAHDDDVWPWLFNKYNTLLMELSSEIPHVSYIEDSSFNEPVTLTDSPDQPSAMLFQCWNMSTHWYLCQNSHKLRFTYYLDYANIVDQDHYRYPWCQFQGQATAWKALVDILILQWRPWQIPVAYTGVGR